MDPPTQPIYLLRLAISLPPFSITDMDLVRGCKGLKSPVPESLNKSLTPSQMRGQMLTLMQCQCESIDVMTLIVCHSICL